MQAARRSSLGLVGLAGLGLLAGLWAGLVRIGWSLPPLEAELVALHGPLMVGGFLGVVIALERAVALAQRWAFASPAVAGVATLALLVGLPIQLGAALLVSSSALLVVIFVHIYRLRPEWSTVLMIVGAGSWLVGNALWLVGQPVLTVVPWWVAFLVLTIVGERLELAQVLLGGAKRALLLISAAILVLGVASSSIVYTVGIQLAGLGLLALSLWLLAFDVARRSLRRRGSPRFASVALLLGYIWLGVAAVVWLLGPERVGGFWYDAMLHTIFLGFAFSMIFGHAPTIVPAITSVQLPFGAHFYVPLVLLHASLLLRIVGDLSLQQDVRRWGGLLNELAILLFLAITIAAAMGPASRQSRNSRP